MGDCNRWEKNPDWHRGHDIEFREGGGYIKVFCKTCHCGCNIADTWDGDTWDGVEKVKIQRGCFDN